MQERRIGTQGEGELGHDVRALLVSDVVDSTRLAEALGDARIAALWAAHDRVARRLLVDHGGREIDKTDGFLLLFDDASAAAAYAVAYHRALRSLDPPLQARVGLHVAEVVLRENPADEVARGAKPVEVDGVAKSVAARVMSVATGGQTLLTADARAAIGAALRAVSHGHWRMKGVTEPIELFEVGDEDAPMTPPPDGAKVYRVVDHQGTWLPVREVPHHLPAERDAFVGRASDLRALGERLDRSRLVSVLGIGGTGKTRLVTHFAWTWLGEWPGGAWFCDLSEARSADGIAYAVASALGVQLGEGDPIARLGHAIAGRGECLIVLDNFEQVGRHAAETLGVWLDRARDARFVVTTREVLGLPGETALALTPLVRDEATALFMARAVQAKRDFALTGDDEAAVVALVYLLDGLPLAIELAAARARVMSPTVLLQRMGERFKLLASAGGRHTRQATLRGALDWSWDLLSRDEQQGLAQLSVFEGGFDLAAAEAVLALSEAWPVDVVQALVDKSLVRDRGRDRFDLLVTVHEYAAERLEGLGGRAAAEARHGALFAALGQHEALEALDGVDGPERRRAYAEDLDNLIAAATRAVARGDAEVAVASFLAAWGVLGLSGPLQTGLDLGLGVLTLPLAPEQRAQVALATGIALARLGRLAEARAHCETVIEAADAPQTPAWWRRRLRSWAGCQLALIEAHEGRPEQALATAVAATEEASREVPGAHRDAMQEGRAALFAATVQVQLDRSDAARATFDAGLALLRAVGNERLRGELLANRGGLEFRAGHPERASADFREALAVARRFGNRDSEALACTNLGVTMSQQGRVAEAIGYWEAAIAVARAVGSRHKEAGPLTNLADVLTNQGRFTEAAAALQRAAEIHRDFGHPFGEALALTGLGRVALEQGRPDEAAASFLRAREMFREQQQVRLAAACTGFLGEHHLRLGRLEEALAATEEALAELGAATDRILEVQLHGLRVAILLRLARVAEARTRVDPYVALAWGLPDPVERAKSLALRARVERREGDRAAARATLDQADAILADAGVGPGHERALDQILEEARADLAGP